MEFAKEILKRTGYLFYILDPREHSHKNVEDVRDYYGQVAPIVFFAILVEQFIRAYQNKPVLRMNETVTNASHIFLTNLAKLPFKGFELWAYVWVYNNYRLFDLQWDSPWTWLACWACSDFCYYWMHRLMHEISVLWAFHEPHHTPEDMMLSTPMRNNMFLLQVHWVTSIPMALVIPPPIYLVHYHITIIYQLWLHTEVIGKLPYFIELIFTTPSHHRAHHGRNRRYIDKNYGGYFIIWDRLFGTFEEEDPNEKLVYGLTSQMQSFNPLIIQGRPFMNIWRKFWKYDGIGNKLSALFKGPGWAPGKPWRGNIEEIPHPAPDTPKYDPVLPNWLKMYLKVHFFHTVFTYQWFVASIMFLSQNTSIAVGVFIALSSISYGFCLDRSRYAPFVELMRCICYFQIDKIVYMEVTGLGQFFTFFMIFSRMFFLMSLFMWISLLTYTNINGVYKKIK